MMSVLIKGLVYLTLLAIPLVGVYCIIREKNGTARRAQAKRFRRILESGDQYGTATHRDHNAIHDAGYGSHNHIHDAGYGSSGGGYE